VDYNSFENGSFIKEAIVKLQLEAIPFVGMLNARVKE
jgi:hypothetical protein